MHKNPAPSLESGIGSALPSTEADMTARTRFRRAMGALVVAAGILAWAAPAQAATVYYFHLAGNTKLYLTMDGKVARCESRIRSWCTISHPSPSGGWSRSSAARLPSRGTRSPTTPLRATTRACRVPVEPRHLGILLRPQPARPFELVAGARRGQRPTEGHRAGGWIETAGSGLPGWRLPGQLHPPEQRPSPLPAAALR